MRKKIIFLVLILAIIFSAVGITSIINNRNDFKGPIKAEGLVTTTMDKPTDGSLPTEYDNYDNVAILAGVMEDASFTGLTTGEVVADVAFINYKQKVNNIRTVLDNRAFQQAISYSSLKSVAMQKYFYLDQNKVLTRSGSKVTEDNASWGTNTPDVYSFTQYKNIYGWLPNQISAYIISKETILEISDITTLEDGTYSITMSLDPKKAPANYQYEVKAYGGAKDFPSFSSVSLTVYFNNDWELLKIDTSEVYEISMPGLGSLTCTSNLSEVFSYTDVKMDDNYTNYFESYSDLVPSDGETVPVDDSLEPLDYLMYAFGDYLNGDILYLDVYLRLNDNLITAKLALDIKNMKIVLTSDIFNVVYENNILYLDYQGLKFKLNPSDFSELLGGINLDLDLNSLMDQINEAQITKTENSAVMEANLSLLGINLPVSFTFDVNGEAVKLKSVVLNTTISDFKIGLTATVTNEFNYEYDINNYQDLKNAKFILADILNIINNKALGMDLALNYEDLALKASGKLSFVDDVYMDLAFNLNYDSLNIDGSLKLVNNKLYLDVLGLKLYYEIDLDLNLDPNALIKEVLNISIDKLVSSLILDESGLALDLNIEELLINLKINDLENGLNINVNNLLSMDIYSDEKPFTLDIDDSLYTNINDLMPFITKLLDLINNNYLEMNLGTTISLLGNDINVDGLVKLDLKNLIM